MSETGSIHKQIQVAANGVVLGGSLSIPSGAYGVVLFVHGSGSSRHSPRNQYVATSLNQDGLATLLFDLLSADEERTDMRTREYRFDIPLLARRVSSVIDWLKSQTLTEKLDIGLFGASTGSAAALIAAAQRPALISAIVSRGGRPDLAGDALPYVQTPTLLIVGGQDTAVIELNSEAMLQMQTYVELKTIPGATHLFEEPGTLKQVAALTGTWFKTYLKRSVSHEAAV